ncbi:hypothetical protein C1Y40_05036 [Mycobacterium talmoniae]|uniref:Uncharacterized protein n=1 Tax=Mycobacterium talmoniae TaxID=1858794 RepID=A0A2S8BDU5_9MYCO|nr:hypothetical protein C1Y40_05036 [Mycobacterium talmoniae]
MSEVRAGGEPSCGRPRGGSSCAGTLVDAGVCPGSGSPMWNWLAAGPVWGCSPGVARDVWLSAMAGGSPWRSVLAVAIGRSPSVMVRCPWVSASADGRCSPGAGCSGCRSPRTGDAALASSLWCADVFGSPAVTPGCAEVSPAGALGGAAVGGCAVCRSSLADGVWCGSAAWGESSAPAVVGVALSAPTDGSVVGALARPPVGAVAGLFGVVLVLSAAATRGCGVWPASVRNPLGAAGTWGARPEVAARRCDGPTCSGAPGRPNAVSRRDG